MTNHSYPGKYAPVCEESGPVSSEERESEGATGEWFSNLSMCQAYPGVLFKHMVGPVPEIRILRVQGGAGWRVTRPVRNGLDPLPRLHPETLASL